MNTPVQTSSPPSRIGIDGRNLNLTRGTGVASYARVLMQSYQKIDLMPEVLLQDDPNRANTLLRQRCQTSLRVPRALLPWRQVKRLADNAGDPILLSEDIFRIAQAHFDLYGTLLTLKCPEPPDLMHWTYPLPLYLHGVPNLVTVHDLIPLLQPELTGIRGYRMKRLLQAVIAKADYVLTVSETVRTQLIEVLGATAERVVNCYQAIELSNDLVAAAASAPVLCPAGSFLCFGTEMLRKNTRRLIEAHADSGVKSTLVIIGSDQAASSSDKNILHVPWAPRASLIRAMREARAVLFPSMAEGFGLPIVEAMALGTPVMTSATGATEEIAGGAALLVDPSNVHDIAAAITALEHQPQLRERLRAAGLQRAAFFSEDAYAARLRHFFKTASFS